MLNESRWTWAEHALFAFVAITTTVTAAYIVKCAILALRLVFSA